MGRRVRGREKLEQQKDLLVSSLHSHCGNHSGKLHRLLELEALCWSRSRKLNCGSPVQKERGNGESQTGYPVASSEIIQQTWQTDELVNVSRIEMTITRESCVPLPERPCLTPIGILVWYVLQTLISPKHIHITQSTHSTFWVDGNRKGEFLNQSVFNLNMNRTEAERIHATCIIIKSDSKERAL